MTITKEEAELLLESINNSDPFSSPTIYAREDLESLEKTHEEMGKEIKRKKLRLSILESRDEMINSIREKLKEIK